MARLEDARVSAILAVAICPTSASHLPERIAQRATHGVAGAFRGKVKRLDGLEVEPKPEKLKRHNPKVYPPVT
jgi:hypothetical protein